MKQGCRKTYTEETFDRHKCTTEPPVQLGNNPIKKPFSVTKKKGKKGHKAFKFNFPTPDGSPAKFYSERYARLYRQLGVKDRRGKPMDNPFVKNGKMDLAYVTKRQMKAVMEFVKGNEKYYLVSWRSFKVNK